MSVCGDIGASSAPAGLQLEDTECAFSDRLQEAEPQSRSTKELGGVVRENDTVRCSHGSRCFGLWEKRPGGEIQPVKQGCWPHVGSQQECHSDRCQITAPPSQIQNGNYRFCCCSRDLCNTYFTEAPHTQSLQREETALIALLTVAIAAVVIIALFLGHRMMRGLADVGSVSVCWQLIGRGRYGTVFRGCLHERCVAVKLFSSANRQNYVNERSIYSLPLLQQHDNIAHFLSADERKTADGRPEFLIVMDFYPHGCLSRYLSVHTVDWSTCCRMNHGVTRGLAFLHTELNRGDQYKPAVAHRDVTSRNILVRADLSCVLADFGLSMRLTGSRPCCPVDNDTMAISEVGTVRYMAPEVLGGALNLRDCEAALKQVDVYALGLLYWETFRRCSELFPGEAVPEYQLAFQAELGNHPSFEEMQILVAREKFRPRFPEAWKENSLVLRSLKETMEDCWDQDAEARLTAQCAEERLCELALLSTHTAIQNHRNLCHASSPLQMGSASTDTEDVQVGVVKNLQGVSHSASVAKTTTSGATGVRRNRNSVNYKQQQAQHCNYPGCPLGGAVAIVPICLQLTEEDLEATKLDPKEVDKNLRECSDENLMEISQKQFFSTGQQTTNMLYHQILRTAEVLLLLPHDSVVPQFPTIHLLPKQQNLPQRPTSLHLLSKTKGTTSSSCQRLKSNYQEVETGVAKMNTVTVATDVEPHLVTTVTNNTSMRGSVGNQVHVIMSNGYNVSVPTLVTNGIIGGGQINPAGPQLKEEEKIDRGMIEREDDCMNLLNSNPDEQEPLLRREQLPAKSTPILHQYHHHSKPGDIPTGQGSNSNNNNNRTTLVSASASESAAVLSPALVPQNSGLLRPQIGPVKAKRPERPSSLDLSSACISSGELSLNDVSLIENGSLSTSGEKIKQRVKTPYTLKKWRPTSWVVSTDTALDVDLDFQNSGSTGSIGIPNINQSKSSMAVFLVGGGATATKTSQPDGMTSF
uniref:receptor protein serine/threonine kinase n=1 Tax=Mola mola TaxID=94237 RepID=A0A3Q4BN85_MOLML